MLIANVTEAESSAAAAAAALWRTLSLMPPATDYSIYYIRIHHRHNNQNCIYVIEWSLKQIKSQQLRLYVARMKNKLIITR